MKILVYCVAASDGGALTILKTFYRLFQTFPYCNNEYYFVVGQVELMETANIHVIHLPWAKRNRFLRLFCDWVTTPHLVRQLGIDEVFSLQNHLLPRTVARQTVYLHNCLPFLERRFGFREDRTLWLNQNILGRRMKQAIAKADRLIVQTEWMKKACLKAVPANPDKFEIQPVEVARTEVKLFEDLPANRRRFFYPASGFLFKNHRIIVEACRLLKEKGIDDYEVLFTLRGDENREIAELSAIVSKEHLPIRFAGTKSRAEVFDLYAKSVLIFPSYAETCGLPMLEAAAVGCPILAADWEVPREILKTYRRVRYFSWKSASTLATEMINILRRKQTL